MVLTPAEHRWFPLIEEFEQSSLSRAVFCDARQLNLRTFEWYRSRWRRWRSATLPALNKPAFVELVLPQTVTNPPPLLRLRLEKQAAVLELPVGVDLDWLKAVVGALC